MKTFIAHVDFYLAKCGGPPGLFYIVITSVQVKRAGVKNWARWVTTGVMRDAFNKVEDGIEAGINAVEDGIDAVEAGFDKAEADVEEWI